MLLSQTSNGKWVVIVDLQSRCCSQIMIMAMVTSIGVVMGREGTGVVMEKEVLVRKERTRQN